MGFTYGSFITALILIGISFGVMHITPSGDCTKLYKDHEHIQACSQMQTLSSVIVVITVVIVMLIIVSGIFSKSEDKQERPWGALPKGYDKQPNLREDAQ